MNNMRLRLQQLPMWVMLGVLLLVGTANAAIIYSNPGIIGGLFTTKYLGVGTPATPGNNQPTMFRDTLTATDDFFGVNQFHTVTLAVGKSFVGYSASNAVTLAASGTHPTVDTMYLDAPVKLAGAAAVTEAATLHITGAPTFGTSKYAILVDAGTVQAPTVNATVAIQANGTAGLTQNFALCTGVACATTCTLHVTQGIVTSATGTCP